MIPLFLPLNYPAWVQTFLNFAGLFCKQNRPANRSFYVLFYSTNLMPPLQRKREKGTAWRMRGVVELAFDPNRVSREKQYMRRLRVSLVEFGMGSGGSS